MEVSNTPSGTQVIEPSSEVMGSDIISFDDLEAPGPVIQGGVDQSNAEESSEEVPAEKEAAKEEAKEEIKEEASGKDDGSTQEVEKSEESVKLIKVSHGEEATDLRIDSMVPVKVDGKLEDVSLQDLRDNYSGKITWDRKNTELGKEKQAFEKDQASLQSYVNGLHELLVEKKDVMGALASLTQVMGGNPMEVLGQLNQQLADQADDWAKMTPEQRSLALKDKELGLWKKNQEVESQRQSALQGQTDLRNRKQAVLDKHGLDEEAFASVVDQAKKAIDSGQGNGFTVNDLINEPELVGEIHEGLENGKKQGAVSELLKEINPETTDEDASLLMKQWEQNPDFTVEDLKEIAVETFGSTKAKNLSKKLRKSQPKAVRNDGSASPQSDNTVWSFDQL